MSARCWLGALALAGLAGCTTAAPARSSFLEEALASCEPLGVQPGRDGCALTLDGKALPRSLSCGDELRHCGATLRCACEPGDLFTALLNHRHDVAPCLGHGPRTTRVELHIDVGVDGAVIDVGADTPPPPGAATSVACLDAQLRTWRFAPSVEAKQYRFPFVVALR